MNTADQYAQQATIEVEDLETRKLMSSVTLEDGILVVRGDNAKPNTINVTMVGGKIQATVGRAKLSVAAAKVIAMSITGGAKADVIDVSPLVKLGAYIDAKGGNDVVRTGGGNDTVVGGDGDDQVTNRGGTDAIYGGAGKNKVLAGRKDTVYAGTGKSTVTGSTNRSLKNPKPVIPDPPTQKKHADTTDGGTDSQQGQQKPIVVPPVTVEDKSNDDSTTRVEDPKPPVVDTPPPVVTPPAPQDPGGFNSGDDGGQSQDPQPPVVVPTSTGPTLYARDFGAKFDGATDDGPAVQAALDALPEGGGTVVIDGVAAIGSDGVQLHGRNNVTLRAAANGDGFVSLPGAAKSTWGFLTTVVVLFDCTNCTVSGLTFDGAGNIGGGVGLQRCTDTTVTGNTLFHMAGGNGTVVSRGGLRNTFSYNSIHDTYDTCRGMWIGNVHPGEMEDSPLILGNTILRCHATGIGGHNANAVVRGNVVRDNAGAGLAIGSYDKNDGYDAVGKDMLVEDNVFSGNLFHGIQSDVIPGNPYTLRITVRGNLCEGNANAGIYAVCVQDWVIENNTCRDNGVVGIEVYRASGVTIRGNTCVSTHAAGKSVSMMGIMVMADPAFAGDAHDQATGDTLCIRNVLVEGNTCTGNGLLGIDVDSQNSGKASGVRVTGNFCSGSGWDGIYINAKAPGLFTDVTCDANTSTGNTRIDINVTLF